MHVADTHPLVYHAFGPQSKLGREAKRIFAKAEKGGIPVFVPTAALWEIAQLIEAGRIRLPRKFEHWCRSLEGHSGFSIVTLEWLDVNEARHLPFADPFDRLIVGTALRLDMPLVTKDQNIIDSRLVETVW